MTKAQYGIDAPQVIRNLGIASIVGFVVPLFVPSLTLGPVTFITSGFIWMGFSCGFMALWMLYYSLYGKMRHRDRQLALIQWKGNEKVLDVGTGRGLMLIGAAKRVPKGFATGIDIWNDEDLTQNSREHTNENVRTEGVSDRVDVKNMNAESLGFEDLSFDVVLSNLCLHNIYNVEGRRRACNEIARVLKSGGVGLISDFKHMREYKQNFEQLGLRTTLHSANYLRTFPPLPILSITKP